VLPGASSARCLDGPGLCPLSARECRAIRARPQPFVRRAPAGAPCSVRALPCSPGTSSALGSTSPGACAYSARVSVLPGHVLSPWFGEPRRARRALQARPPTQAVSCCSAVSLCRREVAQWMLSSVLENSGLHSSCAAYPRDPVRIASPNHSTACPQAGYFRDTFNCNHQLINTDTLLT
jgi:hypothetical protein